MISQYIRAIAWIALVAVSLIIFIQGGTLQSLAIFLIGGIILAIALKVMPQDA